MKKSLIVILAICATVIGVVLYSESEVARMVDPSGEYTAVVTFRKYQAIIPGSPGDGSSKSGYIEVYDSQGRSYGRIPVGLIQQSDDLEWTDSGAMIPAYCEWNFQKGEYRYWNDAQTVETIKTIN